MSERTLHIVQLLVRRRERDFVSFLLYPQHQWLTEAGLPHLSLPTKTTVDDLPEPFLHGTSLEAFVDAVMHGKLGLNDEQYALEQELEPTEMPMKSPTLGVPTHYVIYPVDVWVDSTALDALCDRVGGCWLGPADALAEPTLSPTAQAVLKLLIHREQRLTEAYRAEPELEHHPGAPRRLLTDVPLRPSMDALAHRWFSRNRTGVRVLAKQTLDEILDVGTRAFNLRVADPYLRYQQQGVGFAWSFLTHKDRQETHVHSAPVVEIYGVLEGKMEVWWKPYYDRGTSAWNHRILEAGDWAEVDSLQCHIVNWITEGKGVVFKAGPGPLAEVGKLGVKGKTPCDKCPCMKPSGVCAIEDKWR